SAVLLLLPERVLGGGYGNDAGQFVDGRGLVERSGRRSDPRIRPFSRAAAPTAAARRRRADRVRDPCVRSSPGPAGGRRIAGYQRRTLEPCLAGYRCIGGEPEGSDLC